MLRMLKLILLLISSSTAFLSAASCVEPDLIVQAPAQDSSSKNELKERIGASCKEVMENSSSLIGNYGLLMANIAQSNQKERIYNSHVHKTLGENLTQIAELQKKISLNVERLIENKKPFKQASRKQLSVAHALLTSIAQGLDDQNKKCRSAKASSLNDLSLEWNSALKKINHQLAQNECLQ